MNSRIPTSNRTLHFWLALPLLVGVVVIWGCKNQSTESSAAPTGQLWDAVHIAGQHVGYSTTKMKTRVMEGKELVETTNQSHFSIQRNGQTANQTITLTSVETLDGTVMSFSTEFVSGVGKMSARGQRRQDRMHITSFSAGRPSGEKSVRIPDGTLGFFGMEQSLRQSKISPGEKRILKILEPVTLSICTVELMAAETEHVALLHERAKLLRVSSSTKFPGGNSVNGTMWINSSGEILKSQVADLQANYRTDQKTAVSYKAQNLDLNVQTLVRISKPIDRPHQTRRILYRAEVSADQPNDLFTYGASQRLLGSTQNTLDLEVIAIRPDSPLHEAIEDKPKPADSQPSSLIQSNDPFIVELAKKSATQEKDAWQVAIALERFVCDSISAKNFSTAFASASEVARTGEGDCTEHTVLLVACCRARGIPARAAVGLVYAPKSTAFAYHMWAEVWIRDRWIPIDGTLGRGGIGAAHIKVGHTSLSEGSGFESFIPIIDLIGKLKLTVVEMER